MTAQKAPQTHLDNECVVCCEFKSVDRLENETIPGETRVVGSGIAFFPMFFLLNAHLSPPPTSLTSCLQQYVVVARSACMWQAIVKSKMSQQNHVAREPAWQCGNAGRRVVAHTGGAGNRWPWGRLEHVHSQTARPAHCPASAPVLCLPPHSTFRHQTWWRRRWEEGGGVEETGVW